MKILILFASIILSIPGQSNSSKELNELKKLRSEFIKATEEYKTSLAKLLALYESNVTKAEEKLALSRKLLAEGQIPRSQVKENERAVGEAKHRVTETKQQITNADAQIAEILDEAKLAQELKRAKVARKRGKQRPCLNWDIVMSQRQTTNSLSFSYKIVCK